MISFICYFEDRLKLKYHDDNIPYLNIFFIFFYSHVFFYNSYEICEYNKIGIGMFVTQNTCFQLNIY